MPGNTFTKMPFRNFARAPRRTILTILGIGAAVAVLVMILGAIDSFLITVDRGEDAATAGERDRIIMALCDSGNAEIVQRIGNMALLYRENPEKKKRIQLPR